MIHTVNGLYNEDKYVPTLIHEHIRCMSNDLYIAFGKKWFDEESFVDYASDILQELRVLYGVKLFVDGTPIDMGRNVSLLKKISQKSGVEIVASTGLYHYPGCATSRRDKNEIADWFVEEYQNGIQQTGIRPGVLKCASDGKEITMDNSKRLGATGIAQHKTGLPIYVHSNHFENMAFEQLEILLENGANPEKIIMGHSSINYDVCYLEKILKTGCLICVDQCHRFVNNLNEIFDSVIRLCEKGYEDKILFSNDICIYSDFLKKGYTGIEKNKDEHVEKFGFVFEHIYNAFVKAGGDFNLWNKIVCENPYRILDVNEVKYIGR